MARKRKKPGKFRAVKAVKELARERVGTPPASKIVPDRRTRPVEKHKPTLREMLNEE